MGETKCHEVLHGGDDEGHNCVAHEKDCAYEPGQWSIEDSTVYKRYSAQDVCFPEVSPRIHLAETPCNAHSECVFLTQEVVNVFIDWNKKKNGILQLEEFKSDANSRADKAFTTWHNAGQASLTKLNNEISKQWKYDNDNQSPVYYKPQYANDQDVMAEEEKR